MKSTVISNVKCTKTFAAVGLVTLLVQLVFLYHGRLNHYFGIPGKHNHTDTPHQNQSSNEELIQLLNNKSEINFKHIPYNKLDHYICPAFDGGMGNQMFQFASSYGIARHKNMQLLISERCKLMSIFQFNAVIVKDISICKSYRTMREHQNAIFTNRLMTFSASLNVRLTIYLQSHRYFDQYKLDLRKQLTFRNEIQFQANAFIDKNLQLLKISCKRKYAHLSHTNESIQHGNCVYTASKVEEKVTLVGMHVRRGNFLKEPHPRKGFLTASKEYLQRSVTWYQSRYKKLIFIVASNGIEWTKENIPKNITAIYLEDFMPWVDMAVLALCDHFISTVGTFGWWAGWLTGGNVTYYKWPAREHTEYRRSFNKDYSDFFYRTWIGL